MATEGVHVTNITIDFDGSFRHSKELHVYLDEKDPILRHCDREGDGRGQTIQWTLKPPVEFWPSSCLVVQPYHHRKLTQKITRTREKAETVKISFEDLIQVARVPGISPESAELQYTRRSTGFTTTVGFRILRPSDASVSKLTVDNGSTIVSYLMQASEHLSNVLEFMSSFGDVHPIVKVTLTTLSSACELIQRQKTLDNDLEDLSADMNNLLSFLVENETRENLALLKNTTVSILNVIFQASTFIENYLRRNAAGKLWDAQFLRSKLDGFKQSFAKLTINFKDGVDFQIYFDVYHIRENLEWLTQAEERKIDNKQRKLLEEKLRPSEHREKDVQFTEGTRAGVFQEICDWIDEPNGRNLMWLSGSPGSGKSAIAMTLAKKLDERGRLAASFSFQRSRVTDPTLFWRTIAYDLALCNSDIRRDITKLLNSPADAVMNDIDFQFQQLIVNVLEKRSFTHPLIIVVDALDECDSPSRLLKTLQDWAQRSPLCKLFLTSRPEQDIEQSLSAIDKRHTWSIELKTGTRVTSETNDDIRLLVSRGVSDISRQYPDSLPPEWPGLEVVDKIVLHAAGLFIWATTALKYIEGSEEDCGRGLTDRLAQVISGKVKAGDLYGLYLSILDQSFNESSSPLFQEVVGTVLFSRAPVSFRDICYLSRQTRPDPEMEKLLVKLRSVILKGQDRTYSIHHKSFADFLTVEECPEKFRIDTEKQNRLLTLACLHIATSSLHFNIFDLKTSHIRNDDIPDFHSLVHSTISDRALSYSCRFWADHLQASSFEKQILVNLDDLLKNHLLHWLEVLSALKDVRSGLRALVMTSSWLVSNGEEELTSFALDATRFVSFFMKPISESIPHIYLSALPFSPIMSKVAEHYQCSFPQTLSIEFGRASDWPPKLVRSDGHSDPVNSVAYSPDGKHIVSGSSDNTVRVWDAKSGHLIAGPFEGHSGQVSSVAYSPNGEHIVSGSYDGTVCVWDAQSGHLAASPFEGHSRSVSSIAYSPDGEHIVSGSYDGTVRVWDAQSGRLAASPFEGHSGSVSSIAYSPDGKHIVSGSSDNTVHVWDAQSGHLAAAPFDGHSGPVSSVAYSPDGKHIVSGSYDSTVRVWDAQSGHLAAGPFEGRSDRVSSIAYSPNGKHIVSGSSDGTVCVWDVQSGHLAAGPFEGHSGEVSSVAYSPNGKHIVSGSADGTVRVWDVQPGHLAAGPFEGHSDSAHFIAYSPDGKHIVSGSSDNTVRVWDAQSGYLAASPFQGHSGPVSSVAYSPDGKHIISGSWDRTVCVWDVQSGLLAAGPFEGHSDPVSSVAYSPDGKHIVSGSSDSTVRVWDAQSGCLAAGPFEGHSGPVDCVTYSPDGKHIVSGSLDSTVRVWDAQLGLLAAGPFEGHSHMVSSVAYSPDGEHIVSGSYDSTVRVWDAQSGCLAAGPFQGHSDPVTSIAYSPDGKHIVSGSYDSTVCVWDALSGCLAAGPFEGHSGPVWSVAYSPDGKHIVSGSSDSFLCVWDAQSVASYAMLARHFAHFTGQSQMRDGWVLGPQSELLFWVPDIYRAGLWRPDNSAVICERSVRLEFCHFIHGTEWCNSSLYTDPPPQFLHGLYIPL